MTTEALLVDQLFAILANTGSDGTVFIDCFEISEAAMDMIATLTGETPLRWDADNGLHRSLYCRVGRLRFACTTKASGKSSEMAVK